MDCVGQVSEQIGYSTLGVGERWKKANADFPNCPRRVLDADLPPCATLQPLAPLHQQSLEQEHPTFWVEKTGLVKSLAMFFWHIQCYQPMIMRAFNCLTFITLQVIILQHTDASLEFSQGTGLSPTKSRVFQCDDAASEGTDLCA